MPIKYLPETKEWQAYDLTEPEIDYLVTIGKDELIRAISYQMFRQFAEHQQGNLDNIPKEAMGQA
jgi:hypothetical protein